MPTNEVTRLTCSRVMHLQVIRHEVTVSLQVRRAEILLLGSGPEPQAAKSGDVAGDDGQLCL